MNFPIHIADAQKSAKAQNIRFNLLADGCNGFDQYSLVTAGEDAVSIYKCPECDYMNELEECEHCGFGEDY